MGQKYIKIWKCLLKMILNKNCGHCKRSLPPTSFYTNEKSRTGLSSWCKDCTRAKNQAYNVKYYRELGGKDREKWRKVKGTHDVDRELYDSMMVSQENKCKICGLMFDYLSKNTTPHIDHSHSNGKIRGLLCDLCNKGLGHFKDSRELLLKAERYLDDNK